MKRQLKEIKIPFGANDSELCSWEYIIPEGMEATIVDNKIVVKKKDSEDERIRKALLNEFIHLQSKGYKFAGLEGEEIVAWLEKQGKNPNNVYDKELSEILGCVIRRYINDPNISYTEREKVSREIIPYVERLEKKSEQKTVDKIAKEVCKDKTDNPNEKAIVKYLFEKKGYPIDLNGNLVSYEEAMESANRYINYKKEKFIEKAEKYLQEHLIDYWSQRITDESGFITEFKNYMKGE